MHTLSVMPSQTPKAGWVYAIRASQSMWEHVKIGRSRHMGRQLLRHIQRGNPDHLICFGKVRCYDAAHVEALLHRCLQNDRSHGEWFRRSALVEFVVDMIRGTRTQDELLRRIEQRM